MPLGTLMVVALALCILGSAVVHAAQGADWPQHNGPDGNFNPRPTGAKLLDDLSLARLVWTSEYRDLGFAKGSASGYAGHLMLPDTHPGSASGLIVADGKVFASSFRPRGGPWAEKDFRIAPAAAKATPQQLERLKLNASYDADDLAVAIDLQTGKTVWSAVEQGRGLNRYSGKGGHFHLTPAWFGGKLFTMGTCGRIYCYSAADGRKLWEDASGPLVQVAEQQKAELTRSGGNLPGAGAMDISLVVARLADGSGVLIVPQYPGGTDVALRGIDPQTGKTLWTTAQPVTSRWATPALWTESSGQAGRPGRQFLVVATVKGELRMIDPADGRTLWTVEGLMATHYSLTTTPRHVFVNIPSATMERDAQPWARMAAYRISPEKAERAWEMPDKPPFWFENHFDICAMRRVLARDGRVCFYAQGHKEGNAFSILDESTGEILLTTRDVGGSPLFYLVEDRLLYTADAAHGNTRRIEWAFYTLDPKDFRRLGSTWKVPHDNTTAYEVFIELPFIDGRFYMRNWQGQVLCYDLRQRPLAARWELQMQPAVIGLDQVAMPLRLFERPDGRIDQGTAHPPTREQAGMEYGTWRRSAQWEAFECPDLAVKAGSVAGAVPLDMGSVIVPIDLTLQAGPDGAVRGTWTRAIAAGTVVKNSGTLTAAGPSAERFFPTPWLKDQPRTLIGTNPPGTTTTVLTLADATPGERPQAITICIDHDGRKVIRAAGAAGPGGQSWHEVDARGLKALSADRIEGNLVIVLNRDKWQTRQPAPGMVGKVRIAAARKGDGLAGTWSAAWGEAYSFTGTVSGNRVPAQ